MRVDLGAEISRVVAGAVSPDAPLDEVVKRFGDSLRPKPKGQRVSDTMSKLQAAMDAVDDEYRARRAIVDKLMSRATTPQRVTEKSESMTDEERAEKIERLKARKIALDGERAMLRFLESMYG